MGITGSSLLTTDCGRPQYRFLRQIFPIEMAHSPRGQEANTDPPWPGPATLPAMLLAPPRNPPKALK